MSRELINKVGLLDEEFKTGSEDLDYCKRANKLGYKAAVAESSFVFHFGGISRKSHEDEDKAKHVEEDRYNNDRIQFKYGKQLLVIQTGYAFEAWDPNVIRTKGTGGSELAATRMSEEFVKQGYRVAVFGFTGKDKQIINGVEWYDNKDWQKFIDMNYIDIMIVSRYVEFFNYNIRAGKKFLWVHDIFALGSKELVRKYYDSLDGIFCLSPWHRDFFSDYHGVPKDKIILTGNGIDVERFERKEEQEIIISLEPLAVRC